MSSPRGAAKATARTKAAAAKVAPVKPKVVPQNVLSQQAIRLAQEIERGFAESDDVLSVDAMQTLMGALCRVYSTQVQNGASYTPIAQGQAVSPTGIMLVAGGLLRAGDLSVYELGFWQNATGR
jgi:hypothetical protein